MAISHSCCYYLLVFTIDTHCFLHSFQLKVKRKYIYSTNIQIREEWNMNKTSHFQLNFFGNWEQYKNRFHSEQINFKKVAHTSSGIIVSILNRRFRAVEGSMPGTVPGSNIVIMSCMAVVQSCWIVWMTYAPNCK